MSQLVRTRRDINGKTLELVLYQDFTTAGQGLDADNLIVINKESKQRNLSEIERVYLKKTSTILRFIATVTVEYHLVWLIQPIHTTTGGTQDYTVMD